MAARRYALYPSAMNLKFLGSFSKPLKACLIARTQGPTDLVSDIYNYYQWFCIEVPYDIEAYLKEGEAYSLYTDGNGGVFWRRKDDRPNLEEKDVYFGIFKSELQANNVDLPISSYRVDMRYLSGVEEIGNFVWYRPELHKPKQLSLVEEGYIDEVKTYINNGLFEKEKWGEYQLYFGRYEILSSDVRGISVAVVGEETYYLHFWVTKYQDGTFECWPIDGSQVEDDSIDEEKVERIIEYDTISTEMIIKSLWYE